tara:strand:- start:1093 stop:2157 length:1065 start_codon:yes stop_codon:yes gene_type:complete
MKSNFKFFKKKKILPIDKFFCNVLYNNRFGYYNSKLPFGEKGDFLTSPIISNLFSEMVAIWTVYTWELFGKPKNFNIVELGPGDGSLTKILLNSFKKFPKFDASKKIFLYEESDNLKKIQKENISDKNIKWINNFDIIRKGPIVFLGNEFFDAIPIKQFKKEKNFFFEKKFTYDNNYKIKEVFERASEANTKLIKSYKTLRDLKFIEFPKLGLEELKKISKKVSKLQGCILLIDYGYIEPNNQNTLQSVMKHKKNNPLNNLGRADITSHVNFSLLKEFFQKNDLEIMDVITQKKFLENLGILKRAEIIAKNMKFSDQSNLYLRLKRLLSPRSMGNLFKVILAYKFNNNNFAGFK